MFTQNTCLIFTKPSQQVVLRDSLEIALAKALLDPSTAHRKLAKMGTFLTDIPPNWASFDISAEVIFRCQFINCLD
ncbi:hypothetical protein E2C01_031458 [Portunus trituberculatus]|uniref:Uncharacterized protein n=1 Tax=Portunus trituberculatus TaxID=210409 RepID=A0A5B7EUK7_PORTR|nr:hypothetical protein [Portunus trituberculatus]